MNYLKTGFRHFLPVNVKHSESLLVLASIIEAYNEKFRIGTLAVCSLLFIFYINHICKLNNFLQFKKVVNKIIKIRFM